MTKLRKILSVSVMVMTAIVMSGLMNVNTVSAAAQAGDLIKMDGVSSVYYLGSDGKRYVFPNQATYFSWYNDFSGVVTVPASELQSYPLGANVTMRPGTKLVKITTDPSVYAVEPNGVLRKIQSEADAIALYGTNWAKRVVDVADAFFTNYTVGSPLASGMVPAGTLVKNAGNPSVYYYDGTNYRAFSGEAAFNANRFSFANVVTVSNTITAGGNTISGSDFANTAQSGVTPGVQPGQGTGVTVSLSSDTPAAQDLPQSTPVTFLKFNVTASNDGDVYITGVKLSAIGLGNSADIDQVSLFADNQRLNNSARDVDSNNEAQLNLSNPFIVAKGTTKTLEVRAQIASGATGKYGLAVKKAADITTTATVSGSFPVNGNIMSGVNVAVGQLTVENDGTLSNVKLGDKSATLAKFKVSSNGVEDITLKSITLKKDSVSSAADDDFENVKLYMDGAVVATSAGISNKYVTFNFTSPVTILKNNNKRFVVKGDVIDGASKTLKLYMDSSVDLVATGNYYGYSTKVVNSFTGAAAFTIDAGKITIEKINAVNTKVKKDTTNVELGTFKVTANSGKNVELSKFALTITSSNDQQASSTAFNQIENVELYNKNTNTTYDLTYTSGTANKVYKNDSMGLVLTSGVSYELVVRADVKATATNGDYTAKIDAATEIVNNVVVAKDITMKEVGNDTLITDITPNSVSLNKVTIQGAAVELSKNALSTSYNAVVGTSDVEVLNFNVKAGETIGLKMTEVKVLDVNSTTTSSVISEFKLWKNGAVIKSVSASQLSAYEVAFPDLNESIAANATNNYKVTVSLVKDSGLNGKQLKYRLSGYSIEETDKGAAVYDAIAENALANGVIAANETGATSLLSARTVTIKGVGSLNLVMDNTNNDTKYDTFSIAGTNSGALASVKMKSENEDILVTKVKVRTSADISNKISRLALMKGSEEVAYTTTIGTTETVLDQDFTVPQSETTYTLKATFFPIGQNQPGVVGTTTFALDAVEAQGSQSGDLLAAGDHDSSIEAGEIAYESDVNNGVTAVSKETSLVASRISAVELVNSAQGQALSSSITSGLAANAAIIKVTVPTVTNNNDDGSALKLGLDVEKVKIESNATVTAATIERIGGSNGAQTMTVSGSYAQATGTASMTDFQINPGETAYFLVKVTSTFTSTYSGQYAVKVGLDKLDGTAATNDASGTNFSWMDRLVGGSTQTALRINGQSSVTGFEIKN